MFDMVLKVYMTEYQASCNQSLIIVHNGLESFELLL